MANLKKLSLLNILPGAGFCYDPTVITGPKTLYIQTISTLFSLMTPFLSHRYPDILQTWAPEIFLPTTALGGYRDHICSFCWTVISEVVGKVSTILTFKSATKGQHHSPIVGDDFRSLAEDQRLSLR
jgi:hypothetical protein